jgi:hypothetical protein
MAALAFYSVRDLMAAFVLFSVVFLGLGIALLAVLSAEEPSFGYCTTWKFPSGASGRGALPSWRTRAITTTLVAVIRIPLHRNNPQALGNACAEASQRFISAFLFLLPSHSRNCLQPEL